MVKKVLFCLLLVISFIAGYAYDAVKYPGPIMAQRVDFLDLTAPDLRERLEICANTLGLTLEPLADVEQAKEACAEVEDEISRLHEKFVQDTAIARWEVEKMRHQYWQTGYEAGYRSRTER